MSNADFNGKHLTEEKKLWDVYVQSRRIPSNRFNAITTSFVFLVLAANAVFTSQTSFEILNLVRALAENGFTIAFIAIGFLLTGFTVFSTITQPSLFLAMAKVTNPESGLSYLKHNYFVFLRVFIYYLGFAVFSLSIMAFGHPGGAMPTLVSYFPSSDFFEVLLVKACYVVILTWYYFLVVQLKSFLFNIYHSVMTSLRWEHEGHDKEG